MLNIEEALRYMGVREALPAMRAQTAQVAESLCAQVTPGMIYQIFPLRKAEEGFYAGEIFLPGHTAEKMLTGCEKAAVLVCTLGFSFDALLRTQQRRDMARAVMLDACGSAYVENACDEAEKQIAAACPELYLTDRFSPGYGDLPLSIQENLCAMMDAEKRLGVHVSSSYLMTPCKTVTAIIGLSARPQPARIRGCAFCPLRTDCSYHKGGTSCGD